MSKRLLNLIFPIIVILLIFQEYLESKIGIFKYLDELVALIIFVSYILYLIKNRKNTQKIDTKILLFSIIITLLGLASNYKYNYQSNKYIAIDIFSCLKVFLIYIGSYNLKYDIDRAKKNIEKIAKTLSIVIFILGIVNIFFNIGMGFNDRRFFGIDSYEFIYGNPGSLGIILVLLISILSCNKKNNLFILMNLLSMLLTQRGVFIALVGIYIVLRSMIKYRAYLNMKSWIILGVLAIILGIGQLNTYFSVITPRSILLKTSFKIANEYFPLGTGFGTFGSSVTQITYSILYQKYGFVNIYGLDPKTPAFLCDNYWPMVIAQFGWFGFIYFIYIFYQLYKDLKSKTNNSNKLSIYFVYLFILISSIAAQIMTSLYGILAMIILSYLSRVDNEEKEGKT